MEILYNEGTGHTMTIHSQDEHIIKQFALKKPVSRLLVNVAAALGGVGALTSLQPALTLGCGAVGGSATSDNVGPMNLINIRRVAWGIKELSQLRADSPADIAPEQCSVANTNTNMPASDVKHASSISREEIEAIVRSVLSKVDIQ
jgi:hypothetical protein